ncbi:hypothetical protein KBC03_07305 [Patescibacteria group bacterium]|nr:hypothetical protein [Patescibacteria group bacterium]
MTGDANNAPATYKRIPRTWKFQEKNGDLGAVVVSYFTGNTLSAGGTGELFMFVNT